MKIGGGGVCININLHTNWLKTFFLLTEVIAFHIVSLSLLASIFLGLFEYSIETV